MRKQVAAAFGAAVLGFLASSSIAIAQLQTTACPEEWRANAASTSASAATWWADRAQCHSGGALARSTVTEATPVELAARSRRAARHRDIYSTIKDLMESIIDPSADVLWGAVKTIVDQDGIHEVFPTTQEQWLELRQAAVRIIEAGNLLMMPGRQAAPAGTKSEVPGVELEPAQITALMKRKRKSFNAFAKALRGLGVEALRASDARNAPLMLEIGGRMQDVCESCHKTFWYPNENFRGDRLAPRAPPGSQHVMRGPGKAEGRDASRLSHDAW
jgi:hypothetical protein